MNCKYCGKPIEQSIEGELVCDLPCPSQASKEEQDQVTLMKWLETHCEGCEKPTHPAILKRTHGYCLDCEEEHNTLLLDL